ncbi:TetR family transcriptional regulator [Sphingomonas sp. DBB INV C78]|uniref:TetR/AcrR family transcriptional regulator n=1 Tax=Sphingomonas sp. DBB INV C78 TaxID=3349434 RepID=UPI0036D2E784
MAIKTRRGAGRPTKESAAEIADRVLDGAKRAFCRRGISRALMDEIAAEAGVTKHTIYRRYPRKSALLDAVVERELVRFTQWMDLSAQEGSDPLHSLEQTAERFADYGARPENVTFTFFLLAEGAFSSQMFEKFLCWEKLAVRPLVAKISAAQEAGYIIPGDPKEICEILTGLIDGFSRGLRRPTSLDGYALWRAHFEARWATFVRAVGTGWQPVRKLESDVAALGAAA